MRSLKENDDLDLTRGYPGITLSADDMLDQELDYYNCTGHPEEAGISKRR